VSWSMMDKDQLALEWSEKEGPTVRPPMATGFGSLLISQTTNGQATFDFVPEGLICSLTLPIRS